MPEQDVCDSSLRTRPDVRSRFTGRDLRNLRRSLPTCSLRVIALIDFDAFYAQCETLRLGLPASQPLAVQQWNALIAVNYAAKAAGVKRLCNPDDAKLICPHIVLQHVATWREGDTVWAYRSDVRQHMSTDKAALDPYRLQSRKAFELIKSILPLLPGQKVEKASIDEIFLDLSAQVYEELLKRYASLKDFVEDSSCDNHLPPPPLSILEWHSTFVVRASAEVEGRHLDWDDVAFSIGADIVQDVRLKILTELGFTCSAGIARNKTLAKLAAGHKKPNQQTVVRTRAIEFFLSQYKFTKIRGLGGKLGRRVKDAFASEEVRDLLPFRLEEFCTKLGESSGTWVHNVIRGIENEDLVQRTQLQSMLAAKTFIPKAKGFEQVDKWFRIFAEDLTGRLHDQNAHGRYCRPRVITLDHSIDGRFGPTRSKQMRIPLGADINPRLLFELSKKLLDQIAQDGKTWPCLGISVSISDFEEITTGNHHITSFFIPGKKQSSISSSSSETTPKPAFKRKISSSTETDRVCQNKKRDFEIQQDNSCQDNVQVTRSNINVDCEKEANGVDHDISTYRCPKCEHYIQNSDVLEHLDWHVATELQESTY